MTALQVGIIFVALSAMFAAVYLFGVGVGKRKGGLARRVKLTIVTYNGGGEQVALGPITLDELAIAVRYSPAIARDDGGRVPLFGAPLRSAAGGDVAMAVFAGIGPDIPSRDWVRLDDLYPKGGE